MRLISIVAVAACAPASERSQPPAELPQPTVTHASHAARSQERLELRVLPKNAADLRALDAVRPALLACTEQHSDATGGVVFAVTVDASGAVSIASIPANLGLDPEAAACVLDVVRKTRFDAAARTFEIDVTVR